MTGAAFLGQLPTAWLDGLLAMSWQVGILAIVVLGVSLLARKASPRFRYALWCLVLLKLCLPPDFALVTGIGRWLPVEPALLLPERMTVADPTPLPMPESAAAPERPAAAVPIAPAVPEPSSVVPAHGSVPGVSATPLQPSRVPYAVPHVVLKRVLPLPPRVRTAVPWARIVPVLVWLAGMLAMAGLLARSYRHMRRQVRSAVRVTDPQVLTVLREAQDILHVRTPVPLLAAEGISSPVLVGLFRPRILLPARVLAATEPVALKPIFLHELAHLRRGDLWVSWLQVAAQTLYWFHPFVWLTNLRLRAERELIVDDEVLVHLNGERQVYGESLLRVLQQATPSQWLTPAYVGIAEPHARIAFRLQRILEPGRNLSLRLGWPARTAIAALALVLIPQACIRESSSRLGAGDGVSLQLQHFIPGVEMRPGYHAVAAVALSPDSSKLYAAHWQSGTVATVDPIAVFSTAYFSLLDQIPAGGCVGGVAVSPDGRFVYGYRLPTEAEWEYAARGGAQSRGYVYSGSNSVDEVAWNTSNSGDMTHAVGQKQPNELGLYDMTGNVWEWCLDGYDANYYDGAPSVDPVNMEAADNRVMRGRTWNDGPWFLRLARRDWYGPGKTSDGVGFRVCLGPVITPAVRLSSSVGEAPRSAAVAVAAPVPVGPGMSLSPGAGEQDDPSRVRIAGVVVDEQDEPVAGATVIDSEPVRRSATTDGAGRFELDLAEPTIVGQTLIASSADGALKGIMWFDGQFMIPARTDCRIVLRPAVRVEVSVTDHLGNPVPGARVAADHAYYFFEVSETGSDGKVLLTLPADARVRYIMAVKHGVGADYFENFESRTSGLFDTKPLPKIVPLILGPCVRATIRAEDSAGRPLGGAKFALMGFKKPGRVAGINASGGADAVPEICSTADANGEAVFDWVPSHLDGFLSFLSVSPGLRQPGGIEPIVSDQDYHIVARLRRLVPLRGHVRYPDGKPAPGVLVKAEGRGNWVISCTVVGRSKQDGSFDLLLAPNESYIVAAISDDWAAPSRTAILITEDSPAPPETELTLSEGTLVKGRAMSAGKPCANAVIMVMQKGDRLPEPLRREGMGAPSSQTEELGRSTHADSDGNYRIRLGPGRFKFWIDFHWRGKKEVVVGSEAEMTVDLEGRKPDQEGGGRQPTTPDALRISSLGKGWSVEGEFAGTYEVRPDSVRVTLSKSFVTIGETTPQEERYVGRIRVGLGTRSDDGKSWRVPRYGKAIPVGRMVRRGERCDLPVLEFVIPRDGREDLAKCWFVAQVEVSSRDPGDLPAERSFGSCCFAHSGPMTGEKAGSEREQQ